MNKKQLIKAKKEYYNDFMLNVILRRNYFFPKENGINEYREFSILNNKTNDTLEYKKIAFRGITFSNIEYLKKTLFNDKYPERSFLNNDSSLYCSVARLMKIPLFPFKNRSSYTRDFFKNKYEKYITNYDLYFDFDLNNDDNFKDFINEVYKFVLILKTYQLNFYLTFSGSRGFKVLIPNNDFYKMATIIKIHNNIQRTFKFKYLDPAGSFIPSKLMKADYSLVIKNNEINIALPIFYDRLHFIMKYLIEDECFDYFSYDNLREYFQDPSFKRYILNHNDSKYFYSFRPDLEEKRFKRFVKEFDLLRK